MNKKIIIILLFLIIGIFFVIADEVLNPPNNSYITGNFTFNISTTLNEAINLTVYNLTATDTILNNAKIIAFARNETRPGVDDTRYFNLTIFTNNLSEESFNITFKFTNSSNSNNFTNVSITIDRTIPVAVFLTETEANNTYKNSNYIFVNVSISETNFANISFRIFNTTSLVNQSFFSNRTNQINISLNDSSSNLNRQFTYNVTITDLANQQNTSETRKLTLDNTNPTSTLNYPTNSLGITTSTITFKYQVNDLNIANATLFIDNIPLKINSSGLTNNVEDTYTNTTLSDGNHKWYVNARDLANNNINSSIFDFTITTTVESTSGEATSGGAGATQPQPTQPTQPVNQTQPETQTNETQSAIQEITSNINENIIQPIAQAQPKDVQKFVTDSKIYLLLLGGILVLIGGTEIIKKKRFKFHYTWITGAIILAFTFYPQYLDYFFNLFNMFNNLTSKVGVSSSTGLIVFASIIVVGIVTFKSLKRTFTSY